MKRSRPILFWLRLLLLVGVSPAWVVIGLTIANFYQRERAGLEKSVVTMAHVLLGAVDLDLVAAIDTVQALGTSPHLTSGDLAAFLTQAQQVMPDQGGDGIALADANGQQLVNTLQPYGETLPRTSVPKLLRSMTETHRPGVSDLYTGATSGQPQVAVGVPIIRDDRLIYSLTMALLPEHFNDLLWREGLPPGWVIGIFDRTGTIIARTHSPETYVGQKVIPELLRRLEDAPEGLLENATLEGIPVIAAFGRSRFSGWGLAIGVPVAELTAALRNWLWFASAAAATIFIVALALARWVSLHIARSIQSLGQPALALASDAAFTISPTDIREVELVGQLLGEAALILKERTHARDVAELQARIHQAELAHMARISTAGEMAGAITHELSQPLTAILAYARGCLRVLASPPPDLKTLREGTDMIIHQADRAAEILVRLRDFMRSGTSPRHAVAVASLIDGAISLAALEAVPAGVEIAVYTAADVPPVLVDQIQIEQVILNLVRNAIEAMSSARTQVRKIIVEARCKGAISVEVSVSDTGPGIAEENRERIFQAFMSTKSRGMGMGLAITRTIIEAHGGSLRLEPSEKGATFVFELPAA